MTLLASNPPFRPVIESTGGILEHRQVDALSSPAFEIRREGEVLASGTAVQRVQTAGERPWQLYELPIPALEIEEGYVAVLAPGGADEVRRWFDVARRDYGPLLGLPDILAERPDAQHTLEAYSGFDHQLTPEDMAWVYAGRARAMLDDMVRDRLLQVETGADHTARTVGHRSHGEIYLRGWMVADMDRLRRVERYLLVYEMFTSKSTGELEEDESAALADLYLKRAKAALHQLGRIRIDIDQDGTPDDTVDLSRSYRMRRVQG